MVMYRGTMRYLAHQDGIDLLIIVPALVVDSNLQLNKNYSLKQFTSLAHKAGIEKINNKTTVKLYTDVPFMCACVYRRERERGGRERETNFEISSTALITSTESVSST